MTSLLILLLLASLSSSFGLSLSSRIVNGETVKLGEMPHFVSLHPYNGGWSFCGGSIITEIHVLTAAHCIIFSQPTDYKIVAGTVNVLTTALNDATTRYGDKIVVHENYDPQDSYVNDIALIKIDRPWIFSTTIRPISLAVEYDSRLFAGQMMTVSGYGLNGSKGVPSGQLLKARVPILNNESCRDIYKRTMSTTIHDSQICTLSTPTLRGTCKGDSGGPSIVNGVLVGIVSWSGQGCASIYYPSVLTRVSSHADWIKRNAV